MGKTTTKEIPSDRREYTSSIPSLSRDDENISQGEKFLGRCLQSQRITRQELWSPCNHRELRENQYPTEAPPGKQSDGRRPGDKSGKSCGYWVGQTSQIAQEG